METLVPNQTFGGMPSGAIYEANINGFIFNVNPIDVTSLGALGCRVITPFNNYNASRAPLSTDDYTKGYNLGSMWIQQIAVNIAPAIYICTEMGSSPGEATWEELTQTPIITTEPYLVFVTTYGAVGNGTHDNTSAIQSAIGSLGGAGGQVWFPTGTFLISSSLILPNNVILVGSGRGATTLLAAAGSNDFNMIQSTNFASLTGTNTVGGTYKSGIWDLSLNGNKASRSGTGNGVSIYGIDFMIRNVEILNCPGNGLYSEWATSDTVPTFNGDSMEAHVDGLKVFSCATDGCVWNGPHDSICRDILTFTNGRYGLNVNNSFSGSPQYAGGGTLFSCFHSYGNGSHGVLCNANIDVDNFESESNGGDGIHVINTSFGYFFGSGVTVYNNTGNGINHTAGYIDVADVQAYSNGASGIVASSNVSLNGVKTYSNGTIGLHIASGANQAILSGVESFSNSEIGVQLDASASIAGIYTHNNGADGLQINANDCSISAIRAETNTGLGININTSVIDLVLSGKCSGNATQFGSLSNISKPAIIDISTYNTAGGQISYTGSASAGDYYCRIATGGTGALSPVTQSQT